MAYVDLDPIRAGIAETPEASDFTSGQQRIEAWQSQHESLSNDKNTPEPDDTNSSDATIVNLLKFSDDSKVRAPKTPFRIRRVIIWNWSTGPVVPSSKQERVYPPEQLRQPRCPLFSPGRKGPGSLSDLTLIYCGKAGLGQISRSFSFNRLTIRLKRSKNLTLTGLPLATIG